MAGEGNDNEIQWLGAGSEEPPADVIRTHGPRWSWWYGLIALAVLVGVVVAIRPHDHKRTASPSPSTRPSSAGASVAPSPPLSSASSSIPPDPGPTSTPTITSVGHALLNVPSGWELFGRASGSVIRIQLAAGRVTVTPMPLLSSNGPTSFVVGPDRVIVRPADYVPGYQIADGQPSELLPSGFPLQGPALPGPDPEHLWVAGNADTTAMTLVSFDGRPTGVSISVPMQYGGAVSDGAGYLLFYGTGGVYDARPNAIQRITSGDLIAIGPTAWLTDECDEHFRCSATVINRATGARHALKTVLPDQFGSLGVISPDGSTAAVIEGGSSGPASIHLIDLVSGADRTTSVTLDPSFNYQDGLFVWSPDSKWLFITNGTGRLYAVATRANQATTLGVNLGPISQLALRTPTG